MYKEALTLVLLLFSISLVFYMFVWAIIYKPIRYCYGKPKYRRNKEGYVEYFDYMRNRWWILTKWDDNDSERKIVLYTSNNNPLEITYKGPGRYKIYFNNDLKQKEYREYFGFKNTKELYENMTEQINNENIITSKVLHDKVKYTIENSN